MLSICPKCKKEIEHEDFLFEVHCDCGSRFNPFMNLEPAPTDVAHAEPPSAGAGLDAPTWQDPMAEQPDFKESQSVFAELKDFAEGTMAEMAVPPLNLDGPPPAASPSIPRAPGAPSDAVLTSGDGLPGYRIDAYLAPVSAVAALNPADSNPLRPGFDALWSHAVAEGANGVVAVRWVLSPDGSRVILSGTPVRCSKEGA
jgi:hypothetical protein